MQSYHITKDELKHRRKKKEKKSIKKTDESKLKIITPPFFSAEVFPIAILFLRFDLHP